MTNDIEMLNCVLQNAEMGCQGITSVRKSLKDSKVDGVLCEHLIKYGKLYHCANKMLQNRGAEPHRVSNMTKAMTRYAAQRDLKRDSSSSHIAEMMIKGNTMGVNKMSRKIREYNGNDPHVSLLAKKNVRNRRRKHKRNVRIFVKSTNHKTATRQIIRLVAVNILEALSRKVRKFFKKS